jgi:hypothetical protein
MSSEPPMLVSSMLYKDVSDLVTKVDGKLFCAYQGYKPNFPQPGNLMSENPGLVRDTLTLLYGALLLDGAEDIGRPCPYQENFKGLTGDERVKLFCSEKCPEFMKIQKILNQK